MNAAGVRSEAGAVNLPIAWSDQSPELRERCAGVVRDRTALSGEGGARMHARERVTSGLPLPSPWSAIAL
ncbi:hypothetical protein [Dolichospermum phage Dfl-JY45]